MRVVRVMKYSGAKIYVLNYWVMWQYFFWYRDELYMQHAYAWPHWWQWLKFMFGGKIYSAEEMGSIESSMLHGAMASLDTLQTKNKNENKNGKLKKG